MSGEANLGIVASSTAKALGNDGWDAEGEASFGPTFQSVEIMSDSCGADDRHSPVGTRSGAPSEPWRADSPLWDAKFLVEANLEEQSDENMGSAESKFGVSEDESNDKMVIPVEANLEDGSDEEECDVRHVVSEESELGRSEDESNGKPDMDGRLQPSPTDSNLSCFVCRTCGDSFVAQMCVSHAISCHGNQNFQCLVATNMIAKPPTQQLGTARKLPNKKVASEGLASSNSKCLSPRGARQSRMLDEGFATGQADKRSDTKFRRGRPRLNRLASGDGTSLVSTRSRGLPCDVINNEGVELKSKEFRCSHCNFASEVRELTVQHIRTVHVLSKFGGKNSSAAQQQREMGCHEESREGFGNEALNADSDDSKAALLDCPECNFQTEGEEDFESHLATHDLKAGSIEPPDSTSAEALLERWSRVGSDEDSDSDEWKPARANFKKKITAKVSKVMSTDTDSKEKMFKCGHCSFTSAVKQHTVHHIRTMHPKHKAKSLTIAKSSAANGDSAERPAEVEENCVGDSDDSCSKKDPLLKCPDCQFQTKNEPEFRVHLATHDPSAAYFMCHTCDEPFATAEAFQLHEALNHKTTPSKLKCPRCKYRPRRFELYLEHLRVIHSIDSKGEPIAATAPRQSGSESEGSGTDAENPLPCRCPECDFTCLDAADMKAHRSEHLHHCQNCDFASAVKNTVIRHNQQVHRQNRRFECESCSYSSFSKFQMTRHRLTHTGERPFVCEVCGRAFADRSTRRRHVASHDQSHQRLFACHVCLFSSRRKDALNAHIKTIHGTPGKAGRRSLWEAGAEPLICRLCPYRSDHQPDMNRHVRQEHGPNVNAYACNRCEYTGKSSDVLKRHRRIHTGEKPYSCPGCNRAFSDYSTFKRHTRFHCKPEQAFAYGCSECHMTFSHQRFLTLHMRKDHAAFDVAVGEFDQQIEQS